MWHETPGLLRAEEHDEDELEIERDGRELHPQDLDDGEDEPEDADELD
jgi:hypothetical protein